MFTHLERENKAQRSGLCQLVFNKYSSAKRLKIFQNNFVTFVSIVAVKAVRYLRLSHDNKQV